MQINKNNKYLIVEVGHKSLSICLPNSSEVAGVNFPEGSIVDMEINNQEELRLIVDGFLQSKKLSNYEVVLVLHDSLCFEVKLSGYNSTEQDLKFTSFLETVPLERVIAKKIVLDDKIAYGAAINRQIYDFFSQIFTACGLNISVAVPAIALSELGYHGQLSDKVCILLSKKIKILKQISFFEDKDPGDHFAKNQRRFIEKHRYLAGLLSLLFVIMALVTSVLTLRIPQSKPKVIPVVAKEKISTPTPTLLATPTVSLTKTSELVTRISYSGNINAEVQEIRSELIRLGVTKIELQTATISGQITQLGFSPRVAQADKFAIEEFLRSRYEQIGINTINENGLDVLIEIGASQ